MLRVAAEGRARGRCRAEPCLAFPCCASLERRGRYARSGHSGGRCVAAIGQVPAGERLPFPLLACPSPRCPGSSERLLQLLLPPRSRARRAAGSSASLLRLAAFACRDAPCPCGPAWPCGYPALPLPSPHPTAHRCFCCPQPSPAPGGISSRRLREKRGSCSCGCLALLGVSAKFLSHFNFFH